MNEPKCFHCKLRIKTVDAFIIRIDNSPACDLTTIQNAIDHFIRVCSMCPICASKNSEAQWSPSPHDSEQEPLSDDDNDNQEQPLE